MKDFLIVGLGGFLGSISRYGVALLMAKNLPEKFYFGTTLVNLIGCLIIGLIAGLLLRINTQWALFIMAGFCGGFTTFSTFALDGLKLIKSGLYMEFFGMVIISLFGGLILCLVGYFISNRMFY